MRYPYVPESEAGEQEYRERVTPVELPPPPLVTSSDPLPRGFTYPDPVIALSAYGAAHGWRRRAQYSRGYAVKYRGKWQQEELCAVRFSNGDYGAFAVYRTIAGRDCWTWRDVWMWGTVQLPFGQGGVTDLKQWLAGQGKMPHQWYREISARVAEQEQRRKETARNRPRKSTREGM